METCLGEIAAKSSAFVSNVDLGSRINETVARIESFQLSKDFNLTDHAIETHLRIEFLA